MAFTIVQSQISASGVTGTPTVSLTWASAPVQGNLLVVALTFRGNATVSESTAQGWIQAVGNIQNGTTAQTEIWYRVAGAGEGTTGPAFNTAAVLYEIAQAEVSGFTGTPTLDKTGSQIATASLTDAVSAASITAGSEFVFAGCGNREGATTGITFSTSTATGTGNVIGSPEPIQNVNAAKNGEGLRASWSTSGASGTSPGITFNLSATTNNNLTAGIATFKGVLAAATAGTVPRATYPHPVLRAHPQLFRPPVVVVVAGIPPPPLFQGLRWPPVRRLSPRLFRPPVTVAAAAVQPVVIQAIRPRPGARRAPPQWIVASTITTGGFSPSRPIRRATPQRPPTRAHPQLFTPPTTVAVVPVQGIVLRGARWPGVRRAASRVVIAPPYNSGGILGQLLSGIKRKLGPPTRPRLFQPPLVVPPGVQPVISQGKRWPSVRHTGPLRFTPPFVPPGIQPIVTQGRRWPAVRHTAPQRFTPPVGAAPGVQPLVSRGHTWPPVRRARGTIFRPPYTGGGIQPQQAQGVRRKPGPVKPSRLVTPPPYTGGGIRPQLARGRQWPAVRHTPALRFTPPFVPPPITPIVSRGIAWPRVRHQQPSVFTPPVGPTAFPFQVTQTLISRAGDRALRTRGGGRLILHSRAGNATLKAR